jgi:parallel beta-helix repeat protein
VRRLTLQGNAQGTNLLGVGASSRVKVVGNYLTNCGYNGALVVYGNTDNLYAFNTVDNQLNISRAFWIGNLNPNEDETRATVADNTLTAVGGTGIVFVGSGQVVRNTLNGVGNTNGAGMALSCTATMRAHDLLVRGNTITGFAYQGIQSDCINDDEYSLNIQVIGNTIRSTPGNGIYVVRARQWTIRDNVIEDVGINGISVQNARRIRIEGNRITDTRTGGARTVADGIRVVALNHAQDVVDVRMDFNTVTNVTTHGIYVTNVAPGTMTDIRMRRNLLTDNGGYGIFVADVADGDITQVVATQNIIQRNVGGDIRMDPSDGVVN